MGHHIKLSNVTKKWLQKWTSQVWPDCSQKCRITFHCATCLRQTWTHRHFSVEAPTDLALAPWITGFRHTSKAEAKRGVMLPENHGWSRRCFLAYLYTKVQVAEKSSVPLISSKNPQLIDRNLVSNLKISPLTPLNYRHSYSDLHHSQRQKHNLPWMFPLNITQKGWLQWLTDVFTTCIPWLWPGKTTHIAYRLSHHIACQIPMKHQRASNVDPIDPVWCNDRVQVHR